MKIIADLQGSIYQDLVASKMLRAQVSGIYTHLPANTQFPYLHLGKMIVSDASCKTNKQYVVISEISIYHRDKSNLRLFQIVELVKTALEAHQFIECEIGQAKDGATSFAVLKMKSAIG